ncbi:hypothetical protein ACLOJK_019670, partial [Asimina triloba]
AGGALLPLDLGRCWRQRTAWMKAVDAGSGQRVEAVASAWAATSAVGAGEAVAVAACWLVGVLADDGDGGQHDERPGYTDPGLVDDEKWSR